MSAKTILYVEDNELNRKMIRHLLRGPSYRLIEAPDGEAGLVMAREEHPDLILMDVQLPKISGIEATRTLRAEPSTPTLRSSPSRPLRSAATSSARKRLAHPPISQSRIVHLPSLT
jgi:two-component system, cell cycle response regulator DivK